MIECHCEQRPRLNHREVFLFVLISEPGEFITDAITLWRYSLLRITIWEFGRTLACNANQSNQWRCSWIPRKMFTTTSMIYNSQLRLCLLTFKKLFHSLHGNYAKCFHQKRLCLMCKLFITKISSFNRLFLENFLTSESQRFICDQSWTLSSSLLACAQASYHPLSLKLRAWDWGWGP